MQVRLVLGMAIAVGACAWTRLAGAQSVVINEFRNTTPDAVELVVVTDGLDLRGMLLKDYSASGNSDGGGAYTFGSVPLWSAVRAGTVIVLRKVTNSTDVSVGGDDFNLDVGLLDSAYFTSPTGTFDLATEDVLQIKSAGSGKAGVAGAIHTFASATLGGLSTNFVNSPNPKLRTASGDTAGNESAEALNPLALLADFDGTNALGNRAAGSLGTWNSASNQVFIFALRGWGSPTNVQFTAAGATVSEAVGGYTVTVSKAVAGGDVSGQVALGGSATLGAGSDYTVSTTSFTLNGATTSATIVVTVNDDLVPETAETVVLSLANIVGGTANTPSSFTLTIADNEAVRRRDLPVWINEIHYDNTGTDTNEGVEVAGVAGLDLGAYRLVALNGSGGAQYSSLTLSGAIDDEGSGWGAVWFPMAGLQNGPPDGIALGVVGAGQTNVLQFLSYEGTFLATSGAAAGMQSEDIGVSEPENTLPVDQSLQLTGRGLSYGDFAWTGPTNHSRGLLNAGQALLRRGGFFFLR